MGESHTPQSESRTASGLDSDGTGTFYSPEVPKWDFT